MRYLVTGGAGFIGSNLVDVLVTKGDVVIFDDFSEGRAANIDHHTKRPDSRVKVIVGDLSELARLSEACRKVDVVFHMAAMSRIQPSINNPLDAFFTNVMGTANVLECARKAGVKRVVYSASSSAYGVANKLYASGGGLHENLPTDCGSPYSLGKKMGEDLCSFYSDFYGLSTVCLRYFNVYGPRHQETGPYSTVIAIFKRQQREGKPFTVVGNGTQRRDFTHVFDAVRANILATETPSASGIYNIGYGKNYSILELAKMIDPKHPVEFVPPRLGEYPVTLACNLKARSGLGWEPKISLEEGLNLL